MSIVLNPTSGITAPSLDLITPLAVADGGSGSLKAPCFYAIATSTQNLTSGVSTKANFTTEYFDTDNCYDTTTSRFTPTVSGYYRIGGRLYPNGTGITQVIASVSKNGSEYARCGEMSHPTGNVGGSGLIIDSLVYMNGTTDYIEILAYITCTSGAQLYYATNAANSQFFANFVRGA